MSVNQLAIYSITMTENSALATASQTHTESRGLPSASVAKFTQPLDYTLKVSGKISTNVNSSTLKESTVYIWHNTSNREACCSYWKSYFHSFVCVRV